MLPLFTLLFSLHSCTTYTFKTVYQVMWQETVIKDVYWCYPHDVHWRTKIRKSTKSINSKSTLLHALRTVGGGVANNLNDVSHLPHSAESFLILSCTSCELTEGSSRRYCTFTSSIRRAPSMTRDSANSQTIWKWGNVWNLSKLYTLV